MVKEKYLVRPAIISDRPKVSKLIHFEPFVHRHLDWVNPLDWIGTPPFLVVEEQKNVVAALGCPPDPPQVAWIRLFVCTTLLPVSEGWSFLWEATKKFLESQGKFIVSAITLQTWFRELLLKEGFHSDQEVVMLLRDVQDSLEEKSSSEVIIRQMRYKDLPIVVEIDNNAFDELWRNSLPSLKYAFSQASWATVAELNGKFIGFQISTRNPLGGHLARLGVLPENQHQGVGYALVADLIHRMKLQGLNHLTVNTQDNNANSLSLYRKLGFNETGERYPVLTFNI